MGKSIQGAEGPVYKIGSREETISFTYYLPLHPYHFGNVIRIGGA